MPERITIEDEALTELTRMTQAASNPVITNSLQGILRQCKLASLWTASTAYSVGAVIQPNVPNGKRYVCVVAGTSDVTEPDFATGRESSTSDNTITWEEAGDEYFCLWDLQRAAKIGWKEKLSKAICAVDVKSGDLSVANSQIVKHCKEMINQYSVVMVA